MMTTIKLKVNDKVLDKLLWLLSHFKKEEVEVISEESNFDMNKMQAYADHQKLIKGKSQLYSLEDIENHLEDIISKYEA